jgi:hypothetical protein
MSFSLDLTKPLGRLGLAINAVVLGAVFYGVSAGAYHYMSHTLPEAEAHAKEAAAKTELVDKAVAKAKAAAKGKASTPPPPRPRLRPPSPPTSRRRPTRSTITPSKAGLPSPSSSSILSAVFFAGFLSVYVQRRANDGGLEGLWLFTNHLGASGGRRLRGLLSFPEGTLPA